MQDYTVKELMVPLSEYATVPEGSTLFDAVLALEKVQEEYDHTRYRHRAILILDKQKRVVGKLSHLDVLWAIDPDDQSREKLKGLASYGFSQKFIRNLINHNRPHGISLKELCREAAKLKVEAFMQRPTEGEYVEPDASLEAAIHQLTTGHHQALLVAKDKEIVGILRLSDVFAAIFHTMKECENDI